MVDTNIKGLLYGLNAVLPHFEEQSSGHIVNMASISALKLIRQVHYTVQRNLLYYVS